MILAEGQLRITKDRIRKKKDREGGEELEMGLARTQRWARPFFSSFLITIRMNLCWTPLKKLTLCRSQQLLEPGLLVLVMSISFHSTP
jgi:hypothetical protein